MKSIFSILLLSDIDISPGELSSDDDEPEADQNGKKKGECS